MEIRAEKEADRLALYHLAQAFKTADAEEIALTETDNCVLVSVARNGVVAAESERLSRDRDKAEREAGVALAFARAAMRVGGQKPPYGTLTGVRPVKVALRYLEKGGSEAARILQKRFLVDEDKAALLVSLAETEVREAGRDEVMLYVSIPFCPTRCRYCSFISSAAPKHLAMIPAYLELLNKELAQTGEELSSLGRRVSAVYVGGGTPGILDACQIRDLTGTIRKEFGGEIPEFTFEIGRPDTVTAEKLAVLADAGVDRICINPQSTRDEVLALNGRAHSARDFYRAMELARALPFRTVNCDLIAGLPGDDAEGFLSSVGDVLALSPENVTVHALCRKKSASDQTDRTEGFPGIREAVSEAHRLCMEKGLLPYYLYRQKMAVTGLENLGFARPGTLSRYNLCMMEDLCHVAACGAGAIGKVLPAGNGRIRRFPRPKYPFEYLAQPERLYALCHDFATALKEFA